MSKNQQDSKPYYYVRFKWYEGTNLEALTEELHRKFKVERFSSKKPKKEIGLFKDEIVEFWVRADTLGAFISSIRAVIYQKVRTPFTQKDLELRNILLKWYPRKSMSPIPFHSRNEPKFELAAPTRGQAYTLT